MGFIAHLGPALGAIHREAASKWGGQDGRNERMTAALEGHQRGQGVAIGQRTAQLLHTGEDRLGLAKHANRQVEQVNAGGRERTGRRLLPGQAPVVGLQGQELVLAEVGFQLQGRAQGAGLEQLHELKNGGLESFFVSHGQRHARSVHRRTGAQHIGPGHGQGFFTEHVFARLCCGHDLIGVQGVRRTQHHALHLRIQQSVLESR